MTTGPKVGCYYTLENGYYDVKEVELPLRSFSYDVELADSLAYL